MSLVKNLIFGTVAYFVLGIFVLIIELPINGVLLPKLLPFALGGAITGVKSIVPILRTVYIVMFVSLTIYLISLLFKEETEEFSL